MHAAHDPRFRFSLTIGPAKQAVPPGHTRKVVVFNTGHTRERIAMSAQQIVRTHGRCVLSPRPVAWAHPHPAAFTLRPGSLKVVRVHVDAHGARGVHDLAVSAVTQTGHAGNVRLAAAVVSQGLARFPGHASARPCVSLSPPAHAQPFPWAGLVFSAVLVLVLVMFARKLARRLNRRSS